MVKPVAIAGAGFSGAVVARQLAEEAGIPSIIFEERDHVAGNCHTKRDPETGVMLHVYGPHIFHTSNPVVWKYLNRFAEFGDYTNRVKAITPRGVFGLPINLLTLNQFFGTALNPFEMKAFLESKADKSIVEPRNFEEQALKMLGSEIYENFFEGYTIKQWGCSPTDLPASILKRLPIRFNYNDNYFNDPWQGIPMNGYTALMENILDHPLIDVRLGNSFDPKDVKSGHFSHVVWTAPLDAFFGYQHGRLGYRTVFWERETFDGDALGNAVINYTSQNERFTRKHEHKHFAPWETHEKTAVFTEYSKETESGDISYYPKRLAADYEILSKYVHLAERSESVSFVGRLATYRYLDMHHVVDEALEFSPVLARAISNGGNGAPVFSGAPMPGYRTEAARRIAGAGRKSEAA